ncbi:sigma-70 family RNA polymerase sigma factor [Tenacibaculum finnmarkense]|uniref:sigma-70 family RNA polymerase sigma factor n=1 Tax=Tenacibaculum finnmarkense TaxID=2781243 RepID=UPI001E499B65|nr:sigma-70 family RNA polymerase sigma factor [Tenacibaculum finnmarkense]MCD8400403.1 sigma-70 family RNA polymerase sigma factor [Tenacibaculum finnmarkense genomovar ulcerans]MCG8785627.1 sigma-70 family RNA polymerase sigma factor [Tenacibaculum finnmarkense]MCG8812984.1 sigma-70 family RNA polymerase sigma factor [Tenacibaculum finnmarkense]
MKLKEKLDFSGLFDTHYEKLYNYAIKIVKDESISNDLLQDTFIKLWENIDSMKINHRSIESFLIITLKNKIIDYFRKESVKKKHLNLYVLNKDIEEEINNEWDLQKKIEDIYTLLPQKTIEIFKLSRDKGHTYAEIAAIKNISIKTVEVHISKALQVFKKELVNFL